MAQRKRTSRRLSQPYQIRESFQSKPADDIIGFWDGNLDFFFNCVACSIGFTNIWRFPYLCHSHGGGIFLIPYFLALFCVGIPLVVLEFSAGQLSWAMVNSWMFCPFFAGIGQITACIALLRSTYCIILLGWILFYFIQSFKTPIPWSNCHEDWSSFHCRDNSFDVAIENCTGEIRHFNNGTCYNIVTGKFYGIYNRTIAEAHGIVSVLPAEAYLKHVAFKLEKRPGSHDISQIQWPIALCVALIWLTVLICQVQGVRLYSKIAYFTTIIPLFILFFIFIRVISLKGSGTGISYYLSPNASHLLTGSIWTRAAAQVFFSLSLASATLIFLARRNRFRYNIVRDALIFVSIDTLFSFFAGLIFFGILGSFALRLNVNVRDVVSSGASILFIVFPQELANISAAKTTCAGFFLMLFLLGFCTQLVCFDIAVSNVGDYLKTSDREKKFLSCSLCASLFLIGLSMTTSGGFNVFSIFEDFAYAGNAIIAALLMIVAVSFYGFRRFCDDIERMVGSNPVFKIPWKYLKWYFIIMWSVITPSFLIAVLMSSLVLNEPSSFRAYKFSYWKKAVGLSMGGLTLATFFLDLVPRFFSKKGSIRKKLDDLLKPHPKWGVPPSPTMTILEGPKRKESFRLSAIVADKKKVNKEESKEVSTEKTPAETSDYRPEIMLESRTATKGSISRNTTTEDFQTTTQRDSKSTTVTTESSTPSALDRKVSEIEQTILQLEKNQTFSKESKYKNIPRSSTLSQKRESKVSTGDPVAMGHRKRDSVRKSVVRDVFGTTGSKHNLKRTASRQSLELDAKRRRESQDRFSGAHKKGTDGK